jgi:hypothetical protein
MLFDFEKFSLGVENDAAIGISESDLLAESKNFE